MRCEKCGKEIDNVFMRRFNYDGSDSWRTVYINEVENKDNGAVFLDIDCNWTGYGLTEEEQMESIQCPHCDKFPFNDKEIQAYDVVRVVCFKGGAE